MATVAPGRIRGGLRTSLDRWASHSNQEARELRRTAEKAGCCAVVEAHDRQRLDLQGTLRTVTLRPRGGVPALEAELYDGTGTITLIFLGRRRIAGIEPGRTLRVQGRIGCHEGVRVMYNPRYDLMPR